MNAPNPARRRLDRYELLAEIARGGMGTVLLARLGGAGGFERLFAIKVMHPELMQNPEFVGMLLDEARVAAKIHHPNVVATVDVRQHDGFYYIVMDYVDGFPLARILDGNAFDRRERIRIVTRALLDAMSGLSAAHGLCADDGENLGIVHRDVSPQNILIGVDGVGRLTDFGIAVAAAHFARARSETVQGKPSYLAPEQAKLLEVDLRADLWALGVILWEALAGRRLFVAATEAETIRKVIAEPIVSPRTFYPELPPDLEALCMRALDRDPSRRHGSAREMALELERVAKRSGLLADTHEVSDSLRARLGPEIAARRRAIQRLGAAVGDATLPATIREVYGLPKLAEHGNGDVRSTVGLATLPASRFLPTTPAGTASERPPARSSHLGGVLFLVTLFGLGSATTLALHHFRLLSDFAPTLLSGTDAAALSPPREGAAASMTPRAATETASSRDAPSTQTEAPSQPADAPSAAQDASPDEPATSAAELESPPAGGPDGDAALVADTQQPAPSTLPTPPKRVQPARASAPAARPRTDQRRVASSRAPEVEPLPVEENPYRLK